MKLKTTLKNNFFYFLINLILYSFLYYLLHKKLDNLFNPFIGTVILINSIIIDYILSKFKIRIIIRFLSIIVIYILLRLVINFIILIVTDPNGYHLFLDKIPYIIFRDSLVAVIIIIFYYVFDSLRIIKISNWKYYLSTLILIFSFILIFNIDVPIHKTFFKNYFTFSLITIFILLLFIFRHIMFHLNSINKLIEKKELYLLIPLFLILILIFFIFLLPGYIEDKGDKESFGLLGSKLFLFDFNNLIELQDEIKSLTNDRVLLLELHGVKDDIAKRISEGWNRQIYLKRFSLEEYVKNGGFKYIEDDNDQTLAPLYIYDYFWEILKKPKLTGRSDIIQTLYLINIEPSALLGSDLLFKCIPLTNWQGSPFKRIYKSYSSVFDETYFKLSLEELSQKKFLAEISQERKKRLLYIGDDINFKKKVEELTNNVTFFHDSMFLKAYAIQEYLKNNYYYSLIPGVSKKSNPIEYFLFGTNNDTEYKGKGYCSYFAFAMTVMLRSIGIVSRVAVGFSPDMQNRTLNYYDIRSNDAHAWVEVYFDDYGWIIFDPTSSNFAPGENYKIDFGNKEERDNLIEEILKNKDKMQEINKINKNNTVYEEFYGSIMKSIRKFGLFLILIGIILFFIIVNIFKIHHKILYLISFKIRKKIKNIYKHYLGKLLDYNFQIFRNESIIEYSKRIKNDADIDLIKLTQIYQESLFRDNKKFNITKKDLKSIIKKINNDFKRISFLKKILSFFNISRLWKKILPVILIFIFLNQSNIYSQDIKTIENYIIEARNAIDQGYFDQALEILNSAEKGFPDKWEPNYEKGKLFYDYNLYENAIIEFLKSKKKGKKSELLYNYLGDSYGSIGEDIKAVKIYEEAYNELYHSSQLYDKLSWMYYKTHELEKSIDFVYTGLNEYPESSDLMMTLGTLYSNINNYEKAKSAYLDAINSSYNTESNNFRSICYYNLSLLENKFLNYDLSMEFAFKSLYQQNRSSAHNQLNYLYYNSLDLKKSYNEVIIASQLQPVTMLPKLSLINIYITSGKLDEAILQIHELLNNKDYSWMLYFGISKNEYICELYKFLAVCYKFKTSQKKYLDKLDLISKIKRPFIRLYYFYLFYYYEIKAANLAIKIGENMIKGGNELDGLELLINSFENLWPKKALKILKLAKSLEVKVNKKKKHLYEINENILKVHSSIFFSKNKIKNQLLNNLNLLDNKWERIIRANLLIELIKISESEEKNNYINEEFFLHSPLLPMNDIKVPVQLAFSDKKFYHEAGKKINKAVKQSGFKIKKDSDILLVAGRRGNNFYMDLYNKNEFINSFLFNVNLSSDKFIEEAGNEIFNEFFIADLE
ncbi:MAG: hypothetical protein JXB50_07335 [Spirochaetes bacterium]|nr:hypothetical protein [Spirochaetota bacterium]